MSKQGLVKRQSLYSMRWPGLWSISQRSGMEAELFPSIIHPGTHKIGILRYLPGLKGLI